MAQKTIKVKYEYSEDYNPVYVNGLHGGITGLGEIVMNFFMERHAVPRTEVYALDDNKNLVMPPTSTEPTDYNESILRYVETGVIMSYPVAVEIHAWLDRHIKTIETQLAKNAVLPGKSSK